MTSEKVFKSLVQLDYCTRVACGQMGGVPVIAWYASGEFNHILEPDAQDVSRAVADVSADIYTDICADLEYLERPENQKLKPTRIVVYWDHDQWVYKVCSDGLVIDDGLVSGVFRTLPDHPDATQLQEAVVAVAWYQGLTLTNDSVAADPKRGGGWAEWNLNQGDKS